MDVETSPQNVDWTRLVQDWIQLQADVDTLMNFWICRRQSLFLPGIPVSVLL